MTRFYSDQYTSDGIDRTAPDELPSKSEKEIDGAFIRYRRAVIDLTGVSTLKTDLDRYFTIRSRDRLIALFAQADGSAVTQDGYQLGAASKSPTEVGGASLDEDVFTAAAFGLDPATGFARTECLCGGDIPDVNRGLPVWDVLDQFTAQSFSADPNAEWTLYGRDNKDGSGGKTVIEVYYV